VFLPIAFYKTSTRFFKKRAKTKSMFMMLCT
jgi:hypothetical protein